MQFCQQKLDSSLRLLWVQGVCELIPNPPRRWSRFCWCRDICYPRECYRWRFPVECLGWRVTSHEITCMVSLKDFMTCPSSWINLSISSHRPNFQQLAEASSVGKAMKALRAHARVPCSWRWAEGCPKWWGMLWQFWEIEIISHQVIFNYNLFIGIWLCNIFLSIYVKQKSW